MPAIDGRDYRGGRIAPRGLTDGGAGPSREARRRSAQAAAHPETQTAHNLQARKGVRLGGRSRRHSPVNGLSLCSTKIYMEQRSFQLWIRWTNAGEWKNSMCSLKN